MATVQELRDTLLEIDETVFACFGPVSPKFPVVIVGGCAFLLNELTQRSVTHDIDILESSRVIRDILFARPIVNGDVAAHADEIPYGFEDRLVPLPLETHCIEYTTPSLEDLVVMKLYAARPNDNADIRSPMVLQRLDWTKLEHLVYGEDEARASVLSQRRYQEMVSAYEAYRTECRR